MILGITLGWRVSYATLSHWCYVESDTHPWFSPKQVVKIYLNNSGANSVTAATGLSQLDLDLSIKRAIYIWNEQSGSSIKLRYMGTTTSTNVNLGIVVVGNDTSACGGSGGAEAETTLSHHWLSGNWTGSKIILYRFRGNCGFTPWVSTPALSDDPLKSDVVRTFVHELGHAVFNMGHPKDMSGNFDDCADSSLPDPVAATMGDGSRNLGNWDLEVAQQRYGVRAQYSSFQKSYMTSPTTWAAPGTAAGSSGAKPLFRMGSLTQLTNGRALGWVDNGPWGATLWDGGTGYQHSVAEYSWASLWGWYYMSPSLGRPVAIASQPSTSSSTNPPVDFLMAYQARTGANLYGSAQGKVCWRRSTNGGSTWGVEQCEVNNTTAVYGLSAAYDPYSSNFLIGYARQSAPGSPLLYNQIFIVVVPATGSSTPLRVNALSLTALHAPSIACTGAQNRCLMAYETSNGALGGTFFGVNQVLGTLNIQQSYTWSLIFFDTPGLAYAPDDNTFRLAQTDSSNAIYSYKMSDSDPTLTWQGTGDVWNSANSQVSTGQFTVRYQGGVNKLQSWFLKYW